MQRRSRLARHVRAFDRNEVHDPEEEIFRGQELPAVRGWRSSGLDVIPPVHGTVFCLRRPAYGFAVTRWIVQTGAVQGIGSASPWACSDEQAGDAVAFGTVTSTRAINSSQFC